MFNPNQHRPNQGSESTPYIPRHILPSAQDRAQHLSPRLQPRSRRHPISAQTKSRHGSPSTHFTPSQTSPPRHAICTPKLVFNSTHHRARLAFNFNSFQISPSHQCITPLAFKSMQLASPFSSSGCRRPRQFIFIAAKAQSPLRAKAMQRAVAKYGPQQALVDMPILENFQRGKYLRAPLNIIITLER